MIQKIFDEWIWINEKWKDLENKEILGCELAVSDKAKCALCRQRIMIGTPRIWIEGKYHQPPPDEGIIKTKRFICHKCTDFVFTIKKYSSVVQEEYKEYEKEKPIRKKFELLMNEPDIIILIQKDQILKELDKNNG